MTSAQNSYLISFELVVYVDRWYECSQSLPVEAMQNNLPPVIVLLLFTLSFGVNLFSVDKAEVE
jgi:hypothetical protein